MTSETVLFGNEGTRVCVNSLPRVSPCSLREVEWLRVESLTS